MQTKSWALALALALVSTSVAESRPRIYFPRHIKRQFTNSTETRDTVFPPASSTPALNSAPSERTGKEELGGQNTFQLPTPQNDDSDPADGFIQGSSNEATSEQNTLQTRSDDNSDVLTIALPNTVLVQSTQAPSVDSNTNGFRGPNTNPNTARPTPAPGATSDNEDSEDDEDSSTSNSSSESRGSSRKSSTESSAEPSADEEDDGAIVLLPTGVVDDDEEETSKSNGKNDPTESETQESQEEPTGDGETDEDTEEDESNGLGQGKGKADSGEDAPLGGGSEDEDEEDDGGVLGGIFGPGNSTKSPEPTTPATGDTIDEDEEDTVEPSTTPEADTEEEDDAEPDTEEDSSEEADDEDTIPPVGGIPDDEEEDTVPPANGNPDNEDDGTDETGEEPATPVNTPDPDSTILDPVTDPIETVIDDIGDEIDDGIDLPLPPVTNDTDPIGNGTDGDDGGSVTIPGTDLPTEPTDGPDEPDGPDGPVSPGGDSTNSPPEPTGPPTSVTTPVDPPVPTDDGSSPGGTGGGSTPPANTGSPTGPGTTSPPTLVPGGDDDDDTTVGPTSTPVGNSTNTSSGNGQGQPTQPPNANPASEPATTVTSIPVLSTVSGTQAWLGTELAADKTASAEEEKSEAPAPTHSAETLPAGMPKTIEATEEDNPPQPDGTTLIRIVFDRRLHYEFVADNFTAAQQIFTYLPNILSYGENIPEDKIQMMRLAPVNSKNSDWFPTGAYLYVPASIIPPLSADIHLPNSLLYHNNKSPIAFQLAAAIDPSFGIIPGSENDKNGDETDPGGAPFSNSEEKSEEQTPQQQGATAGIAMGAVTVAVAYGAAMFIVARRYKRKKQAHRRASSITNTSDMRYSPSGSPAMMGGALLSRDFSGYGGVGGVPGGRESHGSGRSGAGNSGRTAYISAPVAAENSLGWN